MLYSGHSKAKGDCYKKMANCGRDGVVGGTRSGTSHDNGEAVLRPLVI